MDAITVDDEGNCLQTTVKQTRNGFVHNRKSLHIHYHSKENELAILSPKDVRALSIDSVHPFQFGLPAPLNSYVYPTPIVIVRLTNSMLLESLSMDRFAAQCTDLNQKSELVEESVTVYDVPAVPLANDNEDVYEEEEDDDEDVEDNEFSEDEIVEDTDEDWDIEDDDGASTT